MSSGRDILWRLFFDSENKNTKSETNAVQCDSFIYALSMLLE